MTSWLRQNSCGSGCWPQTECGRSPLPAKLRDDGDGRRAPGERRRWRGALRGVMESALAGPVSFASGALNWFPFE